MLLEVECLKTPDPTFFNAPSMITYVTGDLFQSPANVLVNTVNTVGVMGKGIAKDFRLKFPMRDP